MELPSSILRPQKRPKKNLESDFYQAIKRNQKKFRPDLVFTRLESWASQGVPDLVVCDERGKFYFVELKTTKTASVRLSPHQISWMTQHQHAPTYILVRDKNADVFVFGGDQAIMVARSGLLTEPVHKFKNPAQWSDFFRLTFPL